MGYTISRFVHVDRPERSFEVTDLLHYDAGEQLYVSFFHDGVEIGRLFDDAGASRKNASRSTSITYRSPMHAWQSNRSQSRNNA